MPDGITNKKLPKISGALILFCIDYFVYNIYCISSPGKNTVIFFVMQIKILSAIGFQLFKNSFILYRKFKFVTTNSASGFHLAKTILNDFPLISFEDISLSYYIIKGSGFYSFPKNEVVFIVKPSSENQK